MTVYVALDDRLLVVDTDRGTAAERLADADVECVAVSPDAPDRVFVGTFDSGLYRSTDGGDSFEPIGDTVIEHDAVMSARVAPHDPAELWVGTEPSRVYRSRDGGDSFDPLPGLTELPSSDEWYFPPRPDTHHVRWIEPNPGDPDHWYVGIEAGALVQTRDGGGTWADRVAGSRRDNHTLGTHPDAPDRVYAAAGDGYAESSDAGATWDHPQAGLDHRYVWGLAVAPGDPDTVLVSSASGASAAHRRGEAYLYRKRGGEPWERIGGGPEAEVVDGVAGDGDDRSGEIPDGDGCYRAVLAGGTEPGELWAVHNRGLFCTRDAGDTWRRVDVDWPDAYREAPPRALAVV